MKPWQYNIPLEYLEKIEKQYEHYNSFALSPFSKVKKNDIAKWIHEQTLYSSHDDEDDCGYNKDHLTLFSESTEFYRIIYNKKRTAINMFPGVPIGYKEPGDAIFSCLNEPSETARKNIEDAVEDRNCWLQVWAEDEEMVKFAYSLLFEYIGAKITSFGEIYSYFYRNADDSKVKRIFPSIDPAEKISIRGLPYFDGKYIHTLKAKVLAQENWKNHYSNYNKGKSWSALSLRGYTSDPEFITKPVEMNDKWKEEHKDQEFFLQDTPLYDQYPEVRYIVDHMFHGAEIHRIRFMKLKANEGELERHTDLVDPDSGLINGKLARFHFPIVTNPEVKFTVWNQLGVPYMVNMKEGECWVLNTKFPHRVINNGDSDRIHLVIDVLVNKSIYNKYFL